VDCTSCGSYGLYKMVTSGKPFGYNGDIPCLRCRRFSFTSDQFTPAVNQGNSADSLQQRLNARAEATSEADVV
jgi:hypothetical protein